MGKLIRCLEEKVLLLLDKEEVRTISRLSWERRDELIELKKFATRLLGKQASDSALFSSQQTEMG